MIKNLRTWLPVTALAALMASGCMLVSGQFIVPVEFVDFGANPLTVTGANALSGVAINLNNVSEYNDHKEELKDVVDLAILGKVTNLGHERRTGRRGLDGAHSGSPSRPTRTCAARA